MFLTGRLLRALAVLVSAAALAVSPASADNQFDLNAQLKRLMEWWPGHYDNHEQVLVHSKAFQPLNEKPFFRIHTLVQRVHVPELGENLLLVTVYRSSNPKSLLRAELYALSADLPEEAIRIRRHSRLIAPALPSDPGPVEIKAGVLRASEFKPLGPECDLLMDFVGGQFEARPPPRQCASNGEYPALGIVVGEKYQWTRERRVDLKTEQVHNSMASEAKKDWFKQTRAQLFTCVILQNPEGDMRKPSYLTTIHLHDQGDEVDIPWPDGRTLTFTLHSRAFTNPTDHQYPLFRVHEKNNPLPIAYAWANDGAKRFGINIGWFYTRCYEDGDIDPIEEAVRKGQK